MGDFNQYLWVKNNLNMIKSNVLEIGSKFYDTSTFNDFRKLCSDKGVEYVGADLSEGKNVDIVLDFTLSSLAVNQKLNQKFNTVICCSVMEHVKDIFAFANNVSEIVEEDGVLFLSVPFTWEYHGYPNDYWRFTPAAVEYLFKDFTFPNEYRTISSHIPNDIKPLHENPNHFCYSTILEGSPNPEKVKSKTNLLKTIYHIFFNKIINSEQILYNNIRTTRYFRPSCINMVGIKRK